MTGLDTNILVRYLTQDDPNQTEIANREIQDGLSFFITSIVMCELVWVLETAYNYSRQEIISALDQILLIYQFKFENKSLLQSALDNYRSEKGDFSDHLIAQIGKQAGCTETLTFDKELRANSSFRIL
jgi:predicted nucleic-acid-binding protein